MRACSPSPRPTILIADDEAAVRQLLQLCLRGWGYNVIAAENGAAAVALYHEHAGAIGAVILDVNMPRLDGPRACRELRALDPDLPCCFMTGGLGDYTRDDLIDLGALEIFDKPFDFARLADTLEQILCREPVAA